MIRQRLRRLLGPVLHDNPISVQMLGLCSALAVTTSLATALTMSLALSAVLMASSGLISAIRHYLPSHVRLILQITIIASLVIVVDQVLKAYWFELSQRLSIFVSLIVTNCLVLGRAEGYASHHGVLDSLRDAATNALGYSLMLIALGAIRELLGSGRLLGHVFLSTPAEGGSFQPLEVMLRAPSAFLLLGLMVWALRCVSRAEVEADEYPSRSLDLEGRRHD